jgi:hypothetical protein
MVYADDVTHVLTEEGIAYLHRCEGLEQRMAAIRAVAGYTGIGLAADPAQTAAAAEAGIVKTPEDLGIDAAAPTVRCWRRKAFAIWLTGLADSITRPLDSVTGRGKGHGSTSNITSFQRHPRKSISAANRALRRGRLWRSGGPAGAESAGGRY